VLEFIRTVVRNGRVNLLGGDATAMSGATMAKSGEAGFDVAAD
jgi:hypothetical protein